jgi:rubrerythrin
MIERLKRVVRGRVRSHTFCECRRCGTTVEGSARGCPTCESGEIVRYQF